MGRIVMENLEWMTAIWVYHSPVYNVFNYISYNSHTFFIRLLHFWSYGIS